MATVIDAERSRKVGRESEEAAWYSAAGRVLVSLRAHWMRIVLYAFLGSVVATATVLSLPSYYRSGAAFQAEASTTMPVSASLAGLASQFGGMQLGGQNNAQLFGDLLLTDVVLRRVVATRFLWLGDTVPLYVAYNYNSPSLDKRMFDAVKKLRKSISTDVNIRTGLVRFSVEARSPQLSKEIAETLLVALNEANIRLRQARASAERSFTADRAEQARQDLAVAERNLASFFERNRVITGSPSLQMEEARLRRAAEMAQQVFVQLRLQEEQAAVQSLRNTPSISVIDPPLVPVKRSWPRRGLAIVLAFLLGGLIGAAPAVSRL